MKATKWLYLAAGFVVGVSYLVACGGSTNSIAATIGDAVDVVYSNVTSALTATNVQAAIDEVVVRVKTLEGATSSDSITTDALTGTWVGTQYYNKTPTESVTVTLGANGAFSCSGGASNSALAASGVPSVCAATYTWGLKGHIILLTPSAGGNDYRVIQVNAVDATNVALFFTLEAPTQYEFFYGTKQ